MASDADQEVAARAAKKSGAPRQILIYCPLREGGIAETAHYQACAAVQAGTDVTVLTAPNYLDDRRAKPYRVAAVLWPPSISSRRRWIARLYFAFATVANQYILAWFILRHGVKTVLLAATSETLALVWVWPHIALRYLGVRYAANIHDPQRKMRGRSATLHRLSVKLSLAPIEIALIHEDFAAAQPDIPEKIRCVPVPLGRFDMDLSGADGARIRAAVAPPETCRRVFLAFGYIFDRKNIDLFIRALPRRPEAALVVAGPPGSSRDRPAAYYVELAAALGVADRVKIDAGFVSHDDVKHYFAACDAILLSYKGEFVSQSGVLLVAANWSKPVLASSGDGPLRATVEAFGLGVTVDPDSVSEIERGIAAIDAAPFDPSGWDRFRKHASWNRNVAALFDTIAQIEAEARIGRRANAET